ncbi:MAG: hypothetical protein CMN57_08730 [Gammaproteobacteria bacterium]|nr:hypothetical protein [Gammaproteobacteria bacterium]
MHRILPFLLLALSLCQDVSAGADRLILVSSLLEEHHTRFRDELASALAPTTLDEHRLPPAGREPHPLPPLQAAGTPLIITAGARACAQGLSQAQQPVLCTFITEAAYRRLAGQARAPRHSALFLEQPLSRQLNLASLLLPPDGGLVVLRPQAATDADSLRAAAVRAGVSLSILTLPPGDNPARRIQQGMDRHQMLLALPDPAIYNRHSIHGILLTTYRKGIAVIGFSDSFVKAGAIAAVHSTPEDMARASADIASVFLADTETGLPAPAHPSRFTVTLNHRVAQTLSLALPPEARLHDQLRDMEAGTR